MDKKAFGSRLRQARKDRGLTSEKLSELCNINATYLRQIEGGTKNTQPSGLCQPLPRTESTPRLSVDGLSSGHWIRSGQGISCPTTNRNTVPDEGN